MVKFFLSNSFPLPGTPETAEWQRDIHKIEQRRENAKDPRY
jgi:hypothetical protein